MHTSPEHPTIFDLVRRIPPGWVTTYGDLCPGAPRQAGRALSHAPSGLPWWRVVRADGSLAKGAEQQSRLEAEGVPLRGSRVVMREARIPHEALVDLQAPASEPKSTGTQLPE